MVGDRPLRNAQFVGDLAVVALRIPAAGHVAGKQSQDVLGPAGISGTDATRSVYGHRHITSSPAIALVTTHAQRRGAAAPLPHQHTLLTAQTVSSNLPRQSRRSGSAHRDTRFSPSPRSTGSATRQSVLGRRPLEIC